MPDRNWLEEVYQQHRRELFLTAWNVVQCPSLAEDAVHSAFVRLAELPESPRQPKLYTFRAVRNAAIDLSRARERRLEEPFAIETGAEQCVTMAASDQSSDAAEQALKQLDQKTREVVELHLHENLTFQEIAVLCDEPLPTVASRYRRAMEKLRQLLEVFHE